MTSDKANFKALGYAVLFCTVTTIDTVVCMPLLEPLTLSPCYIPLTVGYLYYVIRFT